MDLVTNRERMAAVRPSPTVEMTRLAREMRSRGVDIASLSVGELESPTPRCIVDVVERALRDDRGTGYTNPRGSEDLVDAMRTKFVRDQGVRYADDEVMSTVGAKGAISLALDALVGAGDEVILFAPYWVSYPDLVALAGATPVVVQTSAATGYHPTAAQLQAALSPRTKAVIFNTPANPTGVVFSHEQLSELLEVLNGTAIWVVSDEIYERVTFDDAVHVSPAGLSEDARRRTLVVSGVSKSYAMTGWRLGVVAGPKQAIDAMLLLQQQRLTCAPALSQLAAAYALREPPPVRAAVQEICAGLTGRREALLAMLARLPACHTQRPTGAFYVWVSVEELLREQGPRRGFASDVELARQLLEQARVATVPGSAFGSPGHLRLSFAAGQETLNRAMTRLAAFVEP